MVVVSMLGVVSAEEGETVVIGTIEFTRYGDTLVETSVLEDLTVKNQTMVSAYISVNESLDENVDIIKAEIPETPEANPSSPSRKFTAFIKTNTQKMVNKSAHRTM